MKKAKRVWGDEVKNQVKKMRKSGATYGEIMRKYNVPKSTLSGWCRDLPNSEHLYYFDRKKWLDLIRKKSSKMIKEKRNNEVEEIAMRVESEMKNWSVLSLKECQKGLLSLLYWAEGQKLPVRGAPIKFANTDPRLMLLFITLLRNCYDLDEKKFRVRLHLHWYHNKREAKKYWSKLLHICEGQFGKTYVKPRSRSRRFRKNYMGICFVIYFDVDLRWEIEHTGYNIQKKISGDINYSRL